jgi:hypothetical protein
MARGGEGDYPLLAPVQAEESEESENSLWMNGRVVM